MRGAHNRTSVSGRGVISARPGVTFRSDRGVAATPEYSNEYKPELATPLRSAASERLLNAARR